MASTSTCPYCNQVNRSTASYCTVCGASLYRELATGQQLHGRYLIVRELGKGGMGALYLAVETIARHKRNVVIKEMLDYYDPADVHAQTKAFQRFEAEAATLASLNIHGIPQVFDFFTDSGRNFIVMQFIEGANLEQRLTHYDDQGNLINGHPYMFESVRRWGIHLCKVLEYLAADSVIHMDIKPANLIVDKADEIWLVDFGTSKAHNFTYPGGMAGRTKSSVFGTVGYAPPEQASGKPETRSDVFALAATMYHLLTDDDPRDEPYKFQRMSKLSPAIRQPLQKALVQDVKKRITAREFRLLLEAKDHNSPVFLWRDGTISYRPEDLASVANRNWYEAQTYFAGEDWRRWFREIHRNDILSMMDQSKQLGSSSEIALDKFLRQLDPTLPSPQLVIPNNSFNAGDVPWQKQKFVELDIENAGGGCMWVQITNLSEGLQVNPDAFSVHDSQRMTIKIDAEKLSPSPSSRSLRLELDAGNAGQEPVKVVVTIPEPRMEINPAKIRLTDASQGSIRHELSVTNSGGSAYLGEITTDGDWGYVNPSRFFCAPGGTYIVQVTAFPNRITGKRGANIKLSARADAWQQTEQVPILVSVPFIKSLSNLKSKLRTPEWPLWIFGWAAYGLMFGAFLGILSDGAKISNTVYAVLTGILFGTLICVSLPAAIGALGGFGHTKGRDGARLGALLGLAPGVIVGGVAGYLAAELLTWMGWQLNVGNGMEFFGALVGVSSCLLLGIITWKLSH